MKDVHRGFEQRRAARLLETESQFRQQIEIPARKSFETEPSPYDEALLARDALAYLNSKDYKFGWFEFLRSVVLGASGFSSPEFRAAFPYSDEAYGSAGSFKPGLFASEGIEHLGRALVAEGKILAFARGENVDRCFRLDPQLFRRIGVGVGRPSGFYPAIYVRCDFMENARGCDANKLKLVERTDPHWQEIASRCLEWQSPRQKAPFVQEAVRMVLDEAVSINVAAQRIVDKYGHSARGVSYRKGTVVGMEYHNAVENISRPAGKILNAIEESGKLPS